MMTNVRRCGVNMNYWWPVAHTERLAKSGMRGIRIGDAELVIVRDETGYYRVYEDACPHKRVRLSRMGQLENGRLLCRYHGWRFNCADGACESLDSMPGQERCFDLKAYPVRLYGGWVWAYTGDPGEADRATLPEIPPAGKSDRFYRVPMEGIVNCHFSYITENATDLYHAELHKAQQPWMNPRLISLEEDERCVSARYEVDTPSLLASVFAGKAKRKHIRVRYEYPYIHIFEEGGGFYLFVTYLPQDLQNTYVFSTFYFPHILPWPWLTRLLLPVVEPLLLPILNQGTFRKVFREDIAAVEEEQRAFNLHARDLSRDTNPTTHAVRRLILRQTEGQAALRAEPLIATPGRPL